MRHDDPSTGTTSRLPLGLLRVLLPRAERDEVLADVRAELTARARADGPDAAR